MLGFSAGAFQGKSKAAEQATKNKKKTKKNADSDSDSVLEKKEGEKASGLGCSSVGVDSGGPGLDVRVGLGFCCRQF